MTRETATVRWLENCDVSAAAHVGGKCAGLGEMIKAGVTVPPGFAVTTAAHREFIAASGIEQRIGSIVSGIDFDSVHSVTAAGEEIRALVDSSPVPGAIERAIRDAYEELGRREGYADVPVAVRSSAIAEDLATASFAGQLETYLWIQGAGDVAEHVRRCWAGLYTPEALAYRARLGLSHERAVMSVAVQRMVEARVAGVMFTLNPLNGDPSKIVIEASFGLGEAVVSGEVDPDRFVVDKVTMDVLERTVSRKLLEYGFDPAQGRVVVRPVPEDRQGAQCLGDDEVVELAQLGKRIERYHGSPQDVEWALGASAAGGPLVLQCRAETVWSQRQDASPIVDVKKSAVDYVLADLIARGPGTETGKEQ